MKIFLIALFGIITTFFGLVPQASAAEGDLAWQDDYPGITVNSSLWSNGHAGLIDKDVHYTAIWEDYVTGKVKVSKRVHGDPGANWDTSINIVPPQGNATYPGTLVITADATGVYVAAPTQVANNLSHGRLALAKLTPQGAFVGNINQVSNGFTSVSDIAVDNTAIYIAGGNGSGWVLEKWTKDLSTSLWKYSSSLDSGKACDEHGPRTVVQDDSYLYLGGCVLNVHDGSTRSRLEKVNKQSHVAEWRRVDASAPAIGTMAIDGANLYIGASQAYWGGWPFGNQATVSSVLQKRSLNDEPAIWTLPFNSERITALVADSDGLYRGFFDSSSRMMKVDKRNFSNGDQIGTKTIVSGVTTSEVNNTVIGLVVSSYINNMSIDSTGIYLAGALSTQCGGPFGYCTRIGGRVEKYGHLGASVLPAVSLSVSGCSTIPVGSDQCSGSINWEFSNILAPQNYNVTSDRIGLIGNTANSGGGATAVNVPVTLKYGSNQITATANGVNTDRPAIAACVGGSVWDAAAVPPQCVAVLAAPTISITATPNLIRNGDTADITVKILDSTSNLTCTVLGVVPHAPIVHVPNALEQTYSGFITKPLTSAQIVQVSCSDGNNTTTKEIRVEVLPKIQEI
ncbi:MAG: hypothetical protein KBC35_04475 [Candidatus Pacebacteria bacterium]|nr:hypothetical protein [Candidatus Paceibacterota bacterium]